MGGIIIECNKCGARYRMRSEQVVHSRIIYKDFLLQYEFRFYCRQCNNRRRVVQTELIMK